MRDLLKLLLLVALVAFAAWVVPAMAEDQPEPNLAADAKMAGDKPPVIPHQVKDDADGNSCNSCHTAGFKAPHPERLNCTQCHVPGDAKKKPAKKGDKKGSKK